jgi:hypothetical protein
MNIYLDIDGTLIHDDLANYGKPAQYLKEFFQVLNRGNHDVYWLTTHCMDGDVSHVHTFLKQRLSGDIFALIAEYKPTTWHEFKTEAIDFSTDFLWFDDNASLQEREILKTYNTEDRLVEINLKENPIQLRDIVVGFRIAS